MATLLDESLKREMARWEASGLRRTLATDAGGGRVDFASNDYLGLARDPRVVEAARRALAEHGAGGRASRLLGGGAPVHEEAERAAAGWLEAEAALLFPSGYQANLGLVGALARRGDVVLSDRRNHASLIDAARLSRARVLVHEHLDLDELARRLEHARSARRRLVLTEGVFSMDGDAPELAELNELCLRHDAWLVVDEAHAVGLLGPAGAGAWAAAGIEGESRLVARVVTGGKALGVCGALVVGSALLRDHLINHARGFVFTTATSPAVPGALVAAVDLCRGMDAERERTLAGARALARELDAAPPAAAIVPYAIGDPARAVGLSRELFDHGLEVRAVRPPTVPEGAAGLRLVVHAHNTPAELDELARRVAAAPRAPDAPVELAIGTERALFVVGTDTGIGKTVVAALLLAEARTHGPAAYWKPVQTGPDSDTDEVARLAHARPAELLRPAWQLALPASPHAAAEDAGIALDPRQLEDGLRGVLRTLPDARVVVELAGGLLVPYRLEPQLETQADWLERARPPLVLVARSGLGTLNHTLLSLEALRARHLEPRALFLVGEEHPSNLRTLERIAHVEHVLQLPPLDPLDAEALEAWRAANDLGRLFAP